MDALLSCRHRLVRICGKLTQQLRLQGKQVGPRYSSHVHNFNVTTDRGVLILEHHDLAKHRANANDVLELVFACVVGTSSNDGHTGARIVRVQGKSEKDSVGEVLSGRNIIDI